MRVLLVSHYSLPHYGGVEVVVEQLARGLVERGHTVRILSSRTNELPYEKRHGFEIFRLKAWNCLERLAIPYPICSPELWRVAHRLVRWADIVHVHGFLYQTTLVSLAIARYLKVPSVLTEHAGFVHYSTPLINHLQMAAISSLGRLSLALANLVTVVSTRVQREVMQLSSSRKPVTLVPVGIDTSIFHPVCDSTKRSLRQQLGWDERPKVLSVGRLVPRKGIDLLLEAMDGSYDLVLCGRGGLYRERRPHVLIYRSPSDLILRHIYQAADLYALASHSEGAFPLSAQQAMAVGLPVVLTFDPLYETYVSDAVVTYVAQNPLAFRTAISRLLRDEQERRRLGQKAVAWARMRFSWDHSVERYLDLYRHLVGVER